MAEYVKRGGGKRFGAAGGKPAFGARSGKPSFAKKPWESRSSTGPITHHKATCTKCGNSCEVPFKPVNGKPVFCRNCFVKTEDAGSGRAGDRYSKREYTPRSYASPAPVSTNTTDISKQLEEINFKLEHLIRAVEASASSTSRKQ